MADNRQAQLGYYDLTDPHVRADQANIARSHGIAGFCYWHYWFGDGQRLLERPFADVLESKAPDFPFCLCWANQTWTGVWHGAPNRVLMRQRYSGDSDLAAHVEFLARAFADPRYIKVEGKPLFLIYSPSDIPEPASYIAKLRSMIEQRGFSGVHLVGMATHRSSSSGGIYDQWLPFGPGDFLETRPLGPVTRLLRRIAAARAGRLLGDNLRKLLRAPITYPYSEVVDAAFETLPRSPEYLPCVLTGWDNTPRAGRRGVVFTGFTPDLLRKYVEKAVDFSFASGASTRFVFLKAWNEWAEGNALEPTEHGGQSSLKAVQAGLQHRSGVMQAQSDELPNAPRKARAG